MGPPASSDLQDGDAGSTNHSSCGTVAPNLPAKVPNPGCPGGSAVVWRGTQGTKAGAGTSVKTKDLQRKKGWTTEEEEPDRGDQNMTGRR